MSQIKQLKIGSKEPTFSLPDSEGDKVSLKDYAGKQLILYFYPKDNRGGCTTEAVDINSALPEPRKLNRAVAGISPDSRKSRH